MKHLEVRYKPSFLREFKKLETALQEEVREKLILFASPKNHTTLHVHKLHGLLTGRWSFSVNYRYRIVFTYEDKKKSIVVLLAIGDHKVYQ